MNKEVVFGDIQNNLKSALFNFKNKKVFVLIDENTAEYCLPHIVRILPETLTLIQIESGEKHKNLQTCTFIWNELTNNGADRNSLLINLGGGVIGDMGGFCAATFKRGIPFINIPTTLLSQVDASIGGKLGVDFNMLKNHIGLFKIPDLVIIDPVFLKTLPERQIKSGFAEIIKHGLIHDRKHWENIKELKLDQANWSEIIPLNVNIKRKIVEADFKESGQRKSLNFGHTAGHAIETWLLNNQVDVLHGEAVAAGMIIESWISHKKGLLSNHDAQDITTHLLNRYEKLKFSINHFNDFYELMKQDKKNKDNAIMFTLLKATGQAIWDQVVSEEDLKKAFQYYVNL